MPQSLSLVVTHSAFPLGRRLVVECGHRPMFPLLRSLKPGLSSRMPDFAVRGRPCYPLRYAEIRSIIIIA